MKKTILAISMFGMFFATSAHAADVTYTFQGLTNIGGTNSFVGTFVYDNDVA